MKHKQEDEEEPILQASPPPHEAEAITYGDSPVEMKCPYCLEHIRSELILKPELITIALGVTIFAAVPNLIMMLLIVALLQFASSRKHRCPLCERELGSDGKFLMYFTDQVYSLQVFSIGLIFTKKTAATILLVAIATSIITLRSNFQSASKITATTWSQYLQQCGESQPTSCLLKYRGKEFENWQGHLLRLEDNRQQQHKWYLHAISMFMAMEPSIHNATKPDVLLTIDSDVLHRNTDAVAELQHGDKIRFNCSLHQRERGNLKDVMHFHITQFVKVGHSEHYSLFTTQIQEQWMRVHLQDKENKLRTQHEPEIPTQAI